MSVDVKKRSLTIYLCGEALPWTRPPVHWEARRPLNSVEAAAAYAALLLLTYTCSVTLVTLHAAYATLLLLAYNTLVV